MTELPRWIVIDDFDSRIQYNGSWFNLTGQDDSLDSVGKNGSPFQDTLHGTQSGNASFSFAFNGTQVNVLGTANVHNTSDGMLTPTWECFVDDLSIGQTLPLVDDVENNWLLCIADSLSDGSHILTVYVSAMTNQPFWFDDIKYVPSSSVPLDQETIVVDSSDPELHYSEGWEPNVAQYGGSAAKDYQTTIVGSTLTFNFIGVSLSWYGVIDGGAEASSSYSIDGQTPIPFHVPASPNTSFQQTIFDILNLSAGSHTLAVVYEPHNLVTNTPQRQALHLDYLIIRNGTLPSTLTTTSFSTSATPAAITPAAITPAAATPAAATPAAATPSAATTHNGASNALTQRKIPVSAIVIASAIGGTLALIIFGILGFYLLRRRQKRAAEEATLTATLQPFGYTPQHPSTTPDHSIRKSSLPTALPAPLPDRSLPPFRTEREANGPAALGSQPRSDSPPAIVFLQCDDSGTRFPTTSVLIDVPPSYTAE